MHDSLAFLPEESMIYIEWEKIGASLSSNLFLSKWPGSVLKFELGDIRSACLDKMLNCISFAKKSGSLVIGRSNITKRLSKLKDSATEFVLVQAIDASESEKFQDRGNIIEYFDSKTLSKICGKQNIHYLLAESDFARKILDIKNKVKYLD
jgi:ribosomal protein L7Ae-like RNA K-turn-binding protein